MLALAALPKVPARWRRPRTTPPTAICIHTIESPETPTGAENCARYFQTITRQAGAHYTVDSDSIIECVDPAVETTPHCYGPSAWSIGIEHAGTARQTPAEWADPYSTAELELSAQLTAALCRRYGIPPVRLLPAQVARREPGIFGHHDATVATSKAGGHTDPGPSFPWGPYIARVRQLLAPAPVTVPIPLIPGAEMQIVLGAQQVNGRYAAAALDGPVRRVLLFNGYRCGTDPAWIGTLLDGTPTIELSRIPITSDPIGMAEHDGDLVVVCADGATYAFPIG